MSDLPSRDIAAQIVKAFDVRGLAADRAGQAMRIVEAYASGRLVDRETMIPMYRQGGISGAWYPVVQGEPEPDGWLAIRGSDEK